MRHCILKRCAFGAKQCGHHQGKQKRVRHTRNHFKGETVDRPSGKKGAEAGGKGTEACIYDQCETRSSIYILKQVIMATLKPKKTKIEDAAVGTYQKIEDKFVEKFLDVEIPEEGDEADK